MSTTTKNSKDLLIGPSAQGFLIGDNTLSHSLRTLTQKSHTYRQDPSITLPLPAHFSALVLEHLTTLPLTEVKSLLRDWKLKEAADKSWNSWDHPKLSESQKILQQLADHLITWVCEEHGLCVRVSVRRGGIHGSRDAFEFQGVERRKAEVVGRIHGLTRRVAEVLEGDGKVVARVADRESVGGEGCEEYESRFFRDFNEKEFELALCAVLLLEKLRIGMENDQLGTNMDELLRKHNSVIELKELFKVKDGKA
jgi:hypothetical protein